MNSGLLTKWLRKDKVKANWLCVFVQYCQYLVRNYFKFHLSLSLYFSLRCFAFLTLQLLNFSLGSGGGLCVGEFCHVLISNVFDDLRPYTKAEIILINAWMTLWTGCALTFCHLVQSYLQSVPGLYLDHFSQCELFILPKVVWSDIYIYICSCHNETVPLHLFLSFWHGAT